MIEEYNIKDFQNGWMHGNFSPSIFKTNKFELGIQHFKANYRGETHYHRHSKECNLVVKGSVRINGKVYSEGDIFVIHPYTVSESYFLEDTTLVISRDSSWSGVDKIIMVEN